MRHWLTGLVVTFGVFVQAHAYKITLSGSHYTGENTRASEIFEQEADCIAQLPLQIQIFEAQTKLKSTTAYCSPASSGFETGYTLSVEGAGTPARYIYPLRSAKEAIVSAAVNQAITSEGGVVAYADKYRTFYYAQRGLDVEERKVFSGAPTECQDQLTEAQKIFTSAGKRSVNVMCVPFSLNNVDFASLYGIGIGGNDIYDNLGHNSAQYASFTACIADREKVIKATEQKGAKVYGALCQSVSSNTYMIRVFTN